MIVQCAWCKKVTGKKEGGGISHTICRDCSIKYFDIDPMEKKPIMENPKKNPPVTTWYGIHKGILANWIIIGDEKFGPFTTKVEAEKEAELFKEVIKENPIKFGSNSKKNQKDHVVKEFTTDVKNKWKSISYESRFKWLVFVGFNEEKADIFAGLDWHVIPINVQHALVDSYMSYWKKYKKNPNNETKLAKETWDNSRYNDRVNVLLKLYFVESDAIKFANKRHTFDSAPTWVQKVLIKYYTKPKKNPGANAHEYSAKKAKELGINPTPKRVTILKSSSSGDYRVPGPAGTEAQAYYTDYKPDALGTVKLMWKGYDIEVKFRTVPDFDRFI